MAGRSKLFVTALASALVWPAQSAAQGPPPGTRLAQPLSDAAAAESLAVLKQLRATVDEHPRDAAAWHRLGIVAWSLMYRGRVGPPMRGVDWTLLGRQADSALRLASSLDPGNARYLLSKAQFFLGTGPMTMRAQSYQMISKVLSSARRSKDSAFRAEALVEAGRLHWRRYDDLANRRTWNASSIGRSIQDFTALAEGVQPGSNSATQPASLANRGQWVRWFTRSSTPLPFELSGAADYYQAESLFREAYAAAPRDARTFREVAMVFAERKRWPELEALARERISRMPHDGDAWMAFGLAVQRRGNHSSAQAVFDTALARLDARERVHITSLARVMPPQDTAFYLTATDSERAAQDGLYWALNDPLWSRGGSDARTEFLARTAFAEIRWTVEELGVRGIDSDRGEMLVRYGPPSIEAQLGPDPQRAELGGNLGAGSFGSADPIGTTGDGGTDIDRMSSVVTVWAYEGGWLVVYRGAPTYATARIPKEDGGTIDSLVRANPSSWANASDVTVNAMRSQVARFRGGQDSVDVYIAVEAPVDEIREAAGTNAAIRANVWLFNLLTRREFRDSTAVTAPSAQAWTYRVPPGTYRFRVEATAEGASVAGRATDSIPAHADPATGFVTRGFGISDPLIARRAVERGAATRWRDLDITPTAGTIRRGAEVSVVWENYELGDSTGSARYGVALTIQRRFKGLLPQIRARIIGAYAAFAGVDRTEDRVVMRFERQLRHARTLVDHVEVALEDTPAGDYTLTLEITDRVTGNVAIRSVPFTIRE